MTVVMQARTDAGAGRRNPPAVLPADTARLSLIMVHFHQSQLLAPALASIDDGALPLEVILVNVGGDVAGAISDDLPFPVRVISRPNRGYAAACNEGLALACGEYVAVSNVDLEFSPNVFSRAVEHLDEHLDVGVLAPALFYPDGRYQHSARRFYNWSAALWSRCPLRGRLAPPRCFREHLMLDERPAGPREIDWAVGAMLVARREALAQRGRIFDERYRLYMEDVDLCLDMWRRGWKVVQVPDIRVVHNYSRRSRKILSSAGLTHVASFIRFVAKHRGLPSRNLS
jgi:hypothetical protein